MSDPKRDEDGNIDIVQVIRDHKGPIIVQLEDRLFCGDSPDKALMRLMKPGTTARAKPVDMLGVVILGKSQADPLFRLTKIFALAGRS